jgi:hypothetical protein
VFVSLLDWLLPLDSHVVIQRTGEVHTFQNVPDQIRRVVDPLGRPSESRSGESLRLELLHAGEYRVATDRDTYRLYANFVDPIESDIGRGAEELRAGPQPAGAQAPVAAGKSRFDAWLYALAAVLFIVEWVVAIRT